MPVAMVPEAKPPIPFVTSHSRDSAAVRLSQTSRPNRTSERASGRPTFRSGTTALLFSIDVFAASCGSVFAGFKPPCHQETSVIVITCAAIKLCGRVVALIDFKMDGVYSQLAGTLFNKFHGPSPYSLPPVFRLDVQLINEGIASVKFETVAERQNNVANRSLCFKENPSLSQFRTYKKLPQHLLNYRFIEIIGARLLLGQIAHHAQQYLFVL